MPAPRRPGGRRQPTWSKCACEGRSAEETSPPRGPRRYYDGKTEMPDEEHYGAEVCRFVARAMMDDAGTTYDHGTPESSVGVHPVGELPGKQKS